MSRAYLAPLSVRTGAVHQQPPAHARRSEFAFDALLNWQPLENIDAPDAVPSGSTRAMDGPTLTIAVTYVEREGVQR